MMQVPMLVRFQLLGHTEPKHEVFASQRLKLTNGIHEIYPETPFIVVVANFSTVPPETPKQMVLCYDTKSPTLLIPVDPPFVAHISESLRYLSSCEPNVAEESPPKPYNMKPPDPREKFLKTPTACAKGPVVCPEYA